MSGATVLSENVSIGRRTRVGLIFDDGFVPSTLVTAKLFEEFRLPAVFAVLAEPGDFAPEFVKGDFGLWNELQARGHIIQPHGLTHAKLSELPHERATDEIARCLDAFSERLRGFEPKRAVYCYAYNSATPQLNEWLRPRVRAFRQVGSGFLSDADLAAGFWHSDAIGPHDPGDELIAVLDRVRRERPPAFLFTLHGLDGEAWGAIALPKLRRVLEIITTDDALEYWPVGR